MKVYNKLVRDNIPEIILADGENPKVRVLAKAEYQKELLKKIIEEVKEVEEAKDNKKELVKEIGDVEEVLEAIISFYGLDKSEIEKVKAERKVSRGGFDKKIFLEYTE
jgi:predicted house-cleaning noncanonical NTP pyrophosphatase (MazG superfamily)